MDVQVAEGARDRAHLLLPREVQESCAPRGLLRRLGEADGVILRRTDCFVCLLADLACQEVENSAGDGLEQPGDEHNGTA
ncbi:hypothetical protein F444_13694 [Phytophthora nicotianae P1976]|uniref:Uncharacterized protein n=1 Tax=Phytophthora nicotianae P1976 TaxID=1317066 RepID=A0A080ZT14_PHYNI|nr:hypothetical protein F444_13694 [Phytophthora nicotianae P1976]